MMRFDTVATGYGGDPTVSEVTGCFGAGKITGIVGPNGSGKTTLLKCAVGLLPVLSGAITLADKPLASLGIRSLARAVSYLPQTRTVPGISVKALVAHGRYPHIGFGRTLGAPDRNIIREAMHRAGIDGLRDRPVSSLSGGERQRAYIAMMLAQDTPVMLLDEPTASLDMGSQYAFMDMLSALKADGKAIAIVLHELPLAMQTCDALWVMRRGKVLRQDDPATLCQDGTLSDAFGIRIARIQGHYIFERANAE